jgi:1,3-propanediol dehydrogenase
MGALSEIGFAVRRMGAVRPLLVSDPGVSDAGWADEALCHLRGVGLLPTVWTGLTPNPKDVEVHAGFTVYQEHECDVLVVVGGGSCIDAAKGIAILASNGGRILDYEGVDKVVRPIPPIVAAPSTAGTASDLSQFAVFTDTARHAKVTLIGHALVPDISITDPRLLMTMPSWLTGTTGLDALTHGIEAFVSRASSCLTDDYALSAISLVHRHLLMSLEQPDSVEHRLGMARASMSAGLAFSNALLGATHAISHQLGGALDLPHGMLNAVLLPHVIRYNAEAVPDRFLRVATALGLDTDRISSTEAGEAAAAAVTELATCLGVPRRLRDIDVRREWLPSFAETALQDACITTNPRPVTREHVLALLEAAF